MNKFDYLIIGGGIAGTTAAEEIRSKDQNGSIAIITEESERLYSRVLLPHFLRNENSLESLFVRKPENYQQKNIQLLTSTRAVKVDTQNKIVTTFGKGDFGYEKLLIASGGKVNKIDIPGSDIPEVVYMRTLEDVKKIKEVMSRSPEAVVIGGGFIGADLAQSFVQNNLKTYAIIREKTFWETVVGENSGQLLSQILTKNGVNLITETQVSEFVGLGKLSGVKLGNGAEVKADLAGVGIGIHLDIEYLTDSGLTIKRGVVTNEFLETSLPGIWAAGDIAEFYDPLSKRYHSLGNWANASSQGRTVGINMVGERIAFQTASMYSINIFDSNFSFLGDPIVDEQTEVIERGSVGLGKLGRILLREDIISGASLINMPLERNVITNLIKNRTKVTASKSRLSDTSFDLAQLNQ